MIKNNYLNHFLENLKNLGWKIISSDLFNPTSSLRTGFNEILLIDELKKFLLNNYPWLDDNLFNEILKKLFYPKHTEPFAINEEMLYLIQGKILLDNKQLSLIDYDNIENNSFLAISPFKIQIPATGLHIAPDVVLFINGLPLAIIECKYKEIAYPTPYIFSSYAKYIHHPIFFYNQFIIAIDNQSAKYSTITELNNSFYVWKNENNEPDIFQILSKKTFTDILQSFIIFHQNSGKEKIVSRYYQYRAVSKLFSFLINKKENKNAIIYQAHGSGKSITTVFSIRKIFNSPFFKDYKVILVTEKLEIESLLEQAANVINFNLYKPKSINELKELLKSDAPGLILGMMKNFAEQELLQEFPILNTSEKTIILVDEAHRSHFKWMNANLQKSLPNSVRIIFTGTPIEKIEGTAIPYLDKYSFDDSIKDSICLDLRFEIKTEPSEKPEFENNQITGKAFKDLLEDVPEEDKKRISEVMARRAYLENKEIIKEKARDLLMHYLTYIFPNKFKAHIISSSHLSAIYYKQEIDKAIKEIIDYPALAKNLNIDFNLLKRIRTAVIIRKSIGDPPAYKPYMDEAEHHKNIESFKMPFEKITDNNDGNTAIIITTDLLLSSFNAPIAQVIYLDHILKDHQLIQAISRVNRPFKFKSCGLIIDYVGVCSHLDKALSIFEEEEISELLTGFKNHNEDLNFLKSTIKKLEELFRNINIFYIDNTDACINALWDLNLRKDFLFLSDQLINYMDRLLPKAEALQFADFFKIICYIRQTARMKFRDESLNLSSLSNKLYNLVLDFFQNRNIDIRIPAAPLFSNTFENSLKSCTNTKIKAKEMIAAVSEYISLNKDKDPVLFEKYSENLNKIISNFSEHAERQIVELEKLIEEIKIARLKEENFGFDPYSELPFFALLMKRIFKTNSYKELDQKQLELNINLTKKILSIIRKEAQQTNLWQNISAQRKLKTLILSNLITFPFKTNINAKAISQELVELAYHHTS